MNSAIQHPSRLTPSLQRLAFWALVSLLLTGCGEKDDSLRSTVRVRYADEWISLNEVGLTTFGIPPGLGWDQVHFCGDFEPNGDGREDVVYACISLFYTTGTLPVGPWSLDIAGIGTPPNGFLSSGPGEFTPDEGHSPLIISAWSSMGCESDQNFLHPPQRVAGKFVMESTTPDHRKGWLELTATVDDAASVSACQADEIVGRLDFDFSPEKPRQVYPRSP
ncbi:hypothetical protein [Myxococcus qinghaiensis]|uniref:hypothetical protein n=1 Tax=Myxococcus qinghaiensis TaxID=2906758 RepID=UPI0020A83101|nr:hypothetical protein [Myxococcus qinghaiensis]MCP3163189.1 hypothetical protein [Myxococcus qinghaiensis]